MTEKLKQIIKDEVGKLPKEVREAVNSFDWIKASEEIARKYKLSESETSDFQAETLISLVGLSPTELYASNIEDNVGISKDEAENMAKEAEEKIFTPINNILQENIKKNLPNKNPSWDQSVDFILSGGDYSVFMDQRGAERAPIDTGERSRPVNPPSLEDIKKKLNIGNT